VENLTDIAVFVRVVETGGFTAAAEALALSQSVVSRRVTALEKRLGVRLLQRTTRRIGLTEAGSELFRRASRGLTEIAEAELEVTRFQAEPRGTLRVTAPTSFSQLHLAPLLSGFVDRFPAVRINLQVDDQQRDLVEEGFDLAIRIATLSDSQLIAQRLAPARQVVCGSPQYFAKRGIPEHPDDLLHHDCIVYTYGRDPGKWRFRAPDSDEDVVVPIQGPVHTNNGIVEKMVVLGGTGLALLPTFYVADELRSGRLQAVLTHFPPVELGIFAVYPERKGLGPKLRAFVDFLRVALNPPPWDQGLDHVFARRTGLR
jgi:DNA-binding transcriptional LysR family regulator